MLNPTGIGVPDHPPGLFKYGLAQLPRMARVFEPFIAMGFTDEEAWDALSTDEERITLARSVYGNRPTKGPKGRWTSSAARVLACEQGRLIDG